MDTLGEVSTDLCTGCGTCAGICPTEAIKMQVSDSDGIVLPKIEEEKCTKCGLCVVCCPGYSMNFKKLNFEIFRKQPKDLLLGNYLRCYIGHSRDNNLRYNSSSGGIATQLLVFALERGLIDGALVVRMSKDSPLQPEPFIARTIEGIISASKSKYSPVAANQALKVILKENGRFAVTGLPCHIHGVRKAEKSVKGLKEKIVLHIGLMCSHTVNFFGTEFLLEKLGITREQIAKIDYRGLGWPGSMHIKLRDHSNLLVPYVGTWNAYWPVFSCFFFTPKRCIMCPDETNELADISLGDAWLPELKRKGYGESIVVARTNKGEELLNLAYSAGVILLRPICCAKVKRSQADPLRFKKEDLGTRLAMLESGGTKIPDFSPKMKPSRSLSSFARNLFVVLNIQASQNKILESLLIHVPLPLFRLYYGVYKFLLLI